MSSSFLRVAATLALAAGLPVAASAQVVPAPPPNGASAQAGHAHRVSPYMRALRSLNLSDSQKSQIRSIMQSYRQKNKGIDQTTRRANMRQMRSDISNVLTPDQRTALAQNLRRMRSQNRGSGAPAAGGTTTPPPAPSSGV
jgi:Spy/CpxP family protein refolding chaperone